MTRRNPDNDPRLRAWEDGFAAHSLGRARQSNPYFAGDRLRKEWDAGWDTSKALEIELEESA